MIEESYMNIIQRSSLEIENMRKQINDKEFQINRMQEKFNASIKLLKNELQKSFDEILMN